MAKKERLHSAKNQNPSEEKGYENYYRLNIRAVDDLVNANEENSPPVSRAELRKYHAQRRIPLTDWAKVVLLKIWFAGIVCYFILWGLSPYLQNQTDLLLVAGAVLGAVTDLITNNVLRFIAKTPGAHDRFMMFPKRRFLTLPLNIIYSFVILFCVVMTYQAVNTVLVSMTGAQDSVPLGVGPILFGVFAMAWDMLFIGMKRMAVRMLNDAKQTARRM
nr:hypothetical protein [uncultured bacterium]